MSEALLNNNRELQQTAIAQLQTMSREDALSGISRALQEPNSILLSNTEVLIDAIDLITNDISASDDLSEMESALQNIILFSPETSVQLYAVEALGEIGRSASAAILLTVLGVDQLSPEEQAVFEYNILVDSDQDVDVISEEFIVRAFQSAVEASNGDYNLDSIAVSDAELLELLMNENSIVAETTEPVLIPVGHSPAVYNAALGALIQMSESNPEVRAYLDSVIADDKGDVPLFVSG
jgi:hypothetical protein